MSTWSTFEAAEPQLAQRARTILTSTTNCVLGSIRADGSPRLSGIDPFFIDGELHLGSMPDSRKARDLQRDPRMALHAVPWESRRTRDGADAPGDADAKLTGRAVEIPHDQAVEMLAAHFAEQGIDVPAEGHLFRVELQTVVVISVEDDLLVIDRWSEAEGRVTVRRS